MPGRGKMTGCPVRPPKAGWQMASACCSGKCQQFPQNFRPQMRLVAQHEAQVEISRCQPFQFAAQTIELNIPRSGCGFSMRRIWKNAADPVRREGNVPGAQHHGDLPRSELLPLRNQMADDRRAAPRQQQFWPAHPRGGASAQNDHPEPEIGPPHSFPGRAESIRRVSE